MESARVKNKPAWNSTESINLFPISFTGRKEPETCDVWLGEYGRWSWTHYRDVIMSTNASQITIFSIVYSAVCSSADKRILPSSASLAFVIGIHRWPMNSPHKGPVTRKMIPFDDVIMDWDIMGYQRARSRTRISKTSTEIIAWISNYRRLDCSVMPFFTNAM